MGTVRAGIARWPGAIAIDSYQYTTSHGVSPGIALLRTLPQATAPAEVGDLVLDDGAESVTIVDCKVDAIRSYRDGEGFVWELEIVDHRWKWRDLGGISGEYNQLDEHGKLIPWTIRSPTELAILCLAAMGEPNYLIDLPPGLLAAVGNAAAAINPPWVGVVPTLGTNPPVNWVAEPPALALAKLAAQYGRRVIWQHLQRRVLIAVAGFGSDLPDGSIARQTPSIKSPETPTGVTVAGSPTVVQARLFLEPVGIEWDGSYRPIANLSYAPKTAGTKQVTNINITGDAGQVQGLTFRIVINGINFVYQPAVGEDALDIATALNNQITGSVNPLVKNQLASAVFAVGEMGQITLTALNVGIPFVVTCDVDAGLNNPLIGIVAQTVTNATPGTSDWSQAYPPMFPGIRPTDRLNIFEARALAQKSVWKCFQLSNNSVEIGVRPAYLQDKVPPVVNRLLPLKIPGYGPLKRRQQIILLPEQVEQVVPPAGDDVLRGLDSVPLTLNFYNGYSRGKPAAVYGAVSFFCQRYCWNGKVPLQNTMQTGQVYVPFSINPSHQVITFESYVYFKGLRGILSPALILQTGINIRDAETNAPARFTAQRLLPGMKGNTNFAVQVHEDVQLNLIGQYDSEEKITGVNVLEADPIQRSTYYLDGMAAQYITSAGLTRTYNGIRAIDLDPAISQITWERTPGEDGGVSTTASRNTEHEVNVPPYPARRRAEFLRSNHLLRSEDAINPPRAVDKLNPNQQVAVP